MKHFIMGSFLSDAADTDVKYSVLTFKVFFFLNLQIEISSDLNMMICDRKLNLLGSEKTQNFV